MCNQSEISLNFWCLVKQTHTRSSAKSQISSRLHFPACTAVAPPPAYLCCALTLRCGDPAERKFLQQQRGAGKVSREEWESCRGPREQHGTGTTTQPGLRSASRDYSLTNRGSFQQDTRDVLLRAASHLDEVCRGFSPRTGAGAGVRVPPFLLLFWGTRGLQSTEKGPNSRRDPGVDSPTVSPLSEPLCAPNNLWKFNLLLFDVQFGLVFLYCPFENQTPLLGCI